MQLGLMVSKCEEDVWVLLARRRGTSHPLETAPGLLTSSERHGEKVLHRAPQA